MSFDDDGFNIEDAIEMQAASFYSIFSSF